MSAKKILVFLFIGILLTFVLIFKDAPPSPLYLGKLVREEVQSKFIFGDEDLTNWYLTLEQKRLDEAEKLSSRKIYFLAEMQKDKALEYQGKAEVLLSDLKNKTNINYLLDKKNQNEERLKKIESTLLR